MADLPAEAAAGGPAALTRGELQDRAVTGSLWTLVNIAVTLPLGVVANAVTARLLGPVGYGKLAFLLAASAAAVPLSELGFGQALAQWGVAAEVASDRSRTELLLRSRFGLALAVQLPVLAVAGLVLVGGEPGWVMAVYALSVVVTLAGAGSQAVLLIQNRTAAMARIAMAVGILAQVATLGAAALTRQASAVWVVRLAVAALAAPLAARLVSARLLRVSLTPRLPRRMPEGFWRFALLAWLAGVSALLVYSRSEVFVLRFYDQATELGLFALAFGLSQQLTLPLDALLAPLFPANSALAAGHPGHIRAAFLRSTRVFALLAGGLLALVPAVAHLAPAAFGPEFSPAAGLFVPLGVTSTLQSAAGPVLLLAFARRRGGVLAGAFAVALALDVAVAFALVPSLGARGAVVANVCGQLTSVGILARRELAAQGTRLRELLAAGRAWFLGLAAMGAGLVAGAPAGPALGPLPAAALAAAAGLGAFTVLLRATGGVLAPEEADGLLRPLPGRARRPVRALLSPAVRRRPPGD